MVRKSVALLAFAVVFMGVSLSHANSGNCSVFRTWNTGDSLTAPDLNSSYSTVGVVNLNTDCLAGFSASVAQMQSTRDPFVAGAEVLTASTTGELQALRFGLQKATGWSQWYKHTERVAIPSHNWLTNPSVETWTNGTAVAPTSWTLVGASAAIARDASNVKQGGFAAALTRVGTDAYLAQDVATLPQQGPISWWQGRAVTMGAWARATVAGRSRICVDDGVGTTCSSYHTGGSSFEYLSITRTLDIAATKVEARLRVDTGDTTAQFDGATLVIGPTVTDALPPTQASSHVPRQDFNYTFNGDVEIWGAGNSTAPTGWALIGTGAAAAKNTTAGQFKIGTASASLTRSGADATLSQGFQAIFGPVAWWQGKTVSLGAWVRATVASRARLVFNDGSGDVFSGYHSGDSTFQFLTLTTTVATTATQVAGGLRIDTGDTTAQFDGAVLVLGSSVSDFIPSGWRGRKTILSFGTDTASPVGPGLTRFLSIGGYNVDGGGVAFSVPYKSVARRHFASSSGAPGAGQTYIYTLQKAGANTSITSTTAESNTSSNDVTNEAAFAAGDGASIKLVTSASTPTNHHKIAVEFEEIP